MDFNGFIAILAFLIGLPWLILHYVTKWKTAPKMTGEDEQLLDEMYNLARRLEDRVTTVERIVAADNPDFRPGIGDYRSTPDYRLDQPSSQRRN
ncbi:phage shock protein B [Sphingomonas sp. BE138]|uniref:envelope stress response membrane protein PspB n=1 Tax=Sphingomonas sp. BE138 TaxID=2817845 RepID=UPI0028667F7C|nr:envelope stress response membrane protein PspB [Sphingomonas sp. BE138]MDR6787779.1 phage shock protein B [Sphingomonas sp. BE138]